MKTKNVIQKLKFPNSLKIQKTNETNITVDVIDKYTDLVGKKHPFSIARKMEKDHIQWFDKSIGILVACLAKDDNGKIVFGIK